MRNFKTIITQFTNIIPKGLFGLLSVLISITGDFIALLMFPEYSMFQYDISYLAIGPGGIFFNIGLIFSGLMAIPFNIYLGKVVSGNNVNESIRKKTVIISIVACIAISLVGSFPVHLENQVILIIHAFLAFVFFLSTTIVFILYGYLFIKNEKFSKAQAYISFVIAGILIIYMIFRSSILEWISMFGIMLGIILIALYTLYKRF